jgi:glutathione S-transferase
MPDRVTLRGYRYSVYNRIVRVALHEKGVRYDCEEVDPFTGNIDAGYFKRQPFGRVPVLSHGAFDIYETAAIVRYVDAAFEGPSLVPTKGKALARAAQVVSIIDNYGYHPLIRQVFAQRVFRNALGEQVDEIEVANGIAASATVLLALESIASERLVLDGQTFTIADCHLAPMIAYFAQAEEGVNALRQHSALSEWWGAVAPRASLMHTDPGLPSR